MEIHQVMQRTMYDHVDKEQRGWRGYGVGSLYAFFNDRSISV